MAKQDHPMPPIRNGLAESLSHEQHRLDIIRYLLIDHAYYISQYLQAKEPSAKHKAINAWIRILQKIGNLATENADAILIQWRGIRSGHGIPPMADYVIFYGDSWVDLGILNRKGLGVAENATRMASAFKTFREEMINSLYVRIPPQWETEIGIYRTAMEIIAQYTSAVRTQLPIIIQKGAEIHRLKPLLDELELPDANLTLTAGINGLNEDAAEKLINAAIAAQKNSDPPQITLYETIFSSNLSQSPLIKPPLEMNHIKWIIRGNDPLGAIETGPPSKQKNDVIRIARQLANDSPFTLKQILDSIYGDDYTTIDSSRLEQRLKLASMVLSHIGQTETSAPMEREIIGNIRIRLQKVRGQVISNLYVKMRIARSVTVKREASPDNFNERIWQIILFLKGRFDTKQKIKAMIRRPVEFTPKDYQHISNDFGIPMDDAKELVAMMRNFFDENGHFQRKSFNRHIPELAWYEEKVFEFLWHYLKDLIFKNDRLAFLNSLQMLITRMKTHRNSLQILMYDFYHNENGVQFYDRNALMLANQLLRKYNQEIKIDIESTPEEVLMIQDGLKQELAAFMARILDRDQAKVFQKVKTIHRFLMISLENLPKSKSPMPPGYLILLERELFIYLSLIGGKTAHSILLSAAREYGNPFSDIYQLSQSSNYLHNLILNLKIIIRGLARIGQSTDIPLLKMIVKSKNNLQQLSEEEEHKVVVGQILRLVESTITKLNQSSKS